MFLSLRQCYHVHGVHMDGLLRSSVAQAKPPLEQFADPEQIVSEMDSRDAGSTPQGIPCDQAPCMDRGYVGPRGADRARQDGCVHTEVCARGLNSLETGTDDVCR